MNRFRTEQMTWTFVVLLLGFGLAAAPHASAGEYLRRQLQHDRVKRAYDARIGALQESFDDAGALWPPAGVFLRAFKYEGEIEVWAQSKSGANGQLVRVDKVPICATSGGLGPKRQQGDLQVPEGVYRVDRFNPRSRFHLSLGLDYPNDYDRAVGHQPLGGDIFIHGDCVTIGCLPIGDVAIESLFVVNVLARDHGQRQIPVHLMPCRFGSESCELALKHASTPERADLWKQLRPIAAAFDRSHRLPSVHVHKGGYSLRRSPGTR